MWAEDTDAQQTGSGSLQDRIDKHNNSSDVLYRLSQDLDKLQEELQAAYSIIQSVKTSQDRPIPSAIYAHSTADEELGLIFFGIFRIMGDIIRWSPKKENSKPRDRSQIRPVPSERYTTDSQGMFAKSGSALTSANATSPPTIHTFLGSICVIADVADSRRRQIMKLRKSPALEQVEAAPPSNDNIKSEPAWFRSETAL
ncbi:hypothetical protein FHL15_002093 [Xylaria flabelliformis]|uniref:Uncharacterized protein n=1 Tax=Xylaria flabelliformis TaxID=2512241 RepID=A0A553I9C6_9PEZI|nr:hypothetical protein FHL15_002093 [Xylaria flabelliformis]